MWEGSTELREALRHTQFAVGLNEVRINRDAIRKVLEAVLEHVDQDKVNRVQHAPVVNLDLPQVLYRD